MNVPRMNDVETPMAMHHGLARHACRLPKIQQLLPRADFVIAFHALG